MAKIAAMVNAAEYDLVLLDVRLPEGKAQPVSKLVVPGQVEWVTQCIELAAEDYSGKPREGKTSKARARKRQPWLKEVVYLKEVARASEATMAEEAPEFTLESLDGMAQRQDGMGQLARVFQRTVREAQAREDDLRREVQQLRIEIDTAKRNEEVSQITNTDYFQSLREQVRSLRATR
jgi:hypothetical protein